MTIIERIGTVNVVRHGQVFFVIDHGGGNVEAYTTDRDARAAALERVDLVDGIAAITRH